MPRWHRLTRFRDDESGAMLLFGLMMLVGILVISGMSVDLVRYESMRTRLQNTLDSATLAAANLDQSLNPTSVVQDYMTKAGLGDYLTNVTVTGGMNNRTVSAQAAADVPTVFLRLAGIDNLTPTTASTASEAIGSVEISLVLDVSGSMNQYNKIGELRNAATEFVTKMFNSTEPGKLSISVVPYAAQVAISPELFNYFSSTRDQTYSYCFDFAQADFKTTAMPLDHTYQQAANFDPWYWDQTTNISPAMRVCPLESNRDVLPFSADESTIKSVIAGLQAGGNTSIDVGMKWGAGLLDPSPQPIMSAMINKGERNADLAGRPYAFDDKEAMKVIVLMTDGENTSRAEINPAYASGTSNVLFNSADRNAFSIYDAASKKYYWSADGKWHTMPFEQGGDSYRGCTSYSRWGECRSYATMQPKGKAVPVTWPELWNEVSVRYFTEQMIYPAYGSHAASTWYKDIVDWQDGIPGYNNGRNSGIQDSNLNHICNEAKRQNITIYSIGFMTSNHGKAVLKTCATKPSYFFDVQNLDIASAFASIANSINKLRLTQ
ncbi:hypothetical protein U879_14960 [Defluviimonas sp. 20V17]|nr:hypothetical protein U879_14960 [Defluviimonas sp. 20V17]